MQRILIIEDDRIVASIYSMRFKANGFEVEVAPEGGTGLKAIHRFQPQLVMLDLSLPEVNGVDIIRKVRTNPATAGLPIVVLSNSYLPEMVQEAWKAGATRCQSKTDCTPNQMLDIVRQLLAGQPQPPPPGQATAPAAWAVSALDPNLTQNFLAEAPGVLNSLRTIIQSVHKAGSSPARQQGIGEVHRTVRAFASNAGLSGLRRTAAMASALEALARDLAGKPDGINASVLRTVVQAVDFLGELIKHPVASWQPDASTSILAVDDEPISRRAVQHALGKAGLKCEAVEDPQKALELVNERRFDLVILDVDMPVMSGFDLCKKIRSIPANQKTPVIFVTSMTDFESRARSMLSGGNDLIGKPFSYMELAVKALIALLKGQLPGQEK